MTGVGRNILPGQGNIAFLGLQHILAAFGLHTSLEFLFTLFRLLTGSVLVGLAAHRAGTPWLLAAGISGLPSRRSWLTHSWRGSLCALRRSSRLSYGRRRHKKRQGDERTQ